MEGKIEQWDRTVQTIQLSLIFKTNLSRIIYSQEFYKTFSNFGNL